MIVGVDAFLKFVSLIPLRDATTKQAKTFLKSIFSSFDIHRNLVSDNANQFVSKEFYKFCFDCRIHHFTTSPYYPNQPIAERVL